MSIALQELVSEAKKNKFSSITNSLSDDGKIIIIWLSGTFILEHVGEIIADTIY